MFAMALLDRDFWFTPQPLAASTSGEAQAQRTTAQADGPVAFPIAKGMMLVLAAKAWQAIPRIARRARRRAPPWVGTGSMVLAD
jgi:hypothetical protein